VGRQRVEHGGVGGLSLLCCIYSGSRLMGVLRNEGDGGQKVFQRERSCLKWRMRAGVTLYEKVYIWIYMYIWHTEQNKQSASTWSCLSNKFECMSDSPEALDDIKDCWTFWFSWSKACPLEIFDKSKGVTGPFSPPFELSAIFNFKSDWVYIRSDIVFNAMPSFWRDVPSIIDVIGPYCFCRFFWLDFFYLAKKKSMRSTISYGVESSNPQWWTICSPMFRTR
jgi:hypothetical protein